MDKKEVTRIFLDIEDVQKIYIHKNLHPIIKYSILLNSC